MDKFIFTDKGLEYAAKTATGSILVFTKGKFGDGTASGDVTKLTDLVKTLGELQIVKKTYDGNQVNIETQFTNATAPDTTLPAFHLKEIGLFAKVQKSDGVDDPAYPETLVCYAHATGSDIGDYIPTTPTKFIINWPFSISNADNVKITVGLGALASQRDLDVLEETLSEHTLKNEIDHPDGSVTTKKIKDRAVTEDKIEGGAVTHVKLSDNSVWENNLGKEAVTNEKIKNDAVTYNKIQNGAVIETKIADRAISTSKIHDRAVTSVKIGNGAVEHENIADNSVWEAQLGQLSVTNEKIANNAVTSNKIADGAVTAAEISDSAVTENKIHDRAVTEDKIAGGAVTHVKLASDSVWEAQLGNQAVTTGKIKDRAVTKEKLDINLQSELSGLKNNVDKLTALFDVMRIECTEFSCTSSSSSAKATLYYGMRQHFVKLSNGKGSTNNYLILSEVRDVDLREPCNDYRLYTQEEYDKKIDEEQSSYFSEVVRITGVDTYYSKGHTLVE